MYIHMFTFVDMGIEHSNDWMLYPQVSWLWHFHQPKPVYGFDKAAWDHGLLLKLY